ncbi:hypothetical protein [Flagellimonas allohymeniacidonis]|uniref:Uncharacterized protein n=1 Tax=Flagellimonas allohymeniacidonis TaxID=2517819 RepID=A0A4Q8QER5_9FLAO|nr:hypothetical protein [Allomuricauda hymeniacidonis]TAI48992.1 hypothetical protein EW142_04135 [Allomuricauda hymeniacidonis]
MTYDTATLFEMATNETEKHNLFFIEDVVSFLPCSKSTFYKYIPLGSNEMDKLKDLLGKNRIALKVELRKKWRESDNATLQMALMKLIATNEERKKLSQSYIDHTSDSKPMNVISLGGDEATAETD